VKRPPRDAVPTLALVRLNTRLSVDRLRKDIINAHLATEAEIDAYFALLDSPNFVAQGFLVMTAWGAARWILLE